MPVLEDLTNKRFGRWSVLDRAPYKNNDRSVYWRCRCECGVTKAVAAGNLKKGLSTSCGCYRSEVNSTNPHYKTPTYNSWDNMIGRCYRSTQPEYGNYGGRGITVCQRWRDSFQNFLADMGERPAGLTIDRKNVNGNYEPGNCVWSTNKDQQNNKRQSLRIPVGDEMLTFEQYSERTGIPVQTLRNRRFAGVPLNMIHLTPKEAGVI